MALARVTSNGMIELPDDVLAEFGIHEGDEFRVERVGGNLALVPADPGEAARAAAERLQDLARNGYQSEDVLEPMTAWEEEAIERYERATARFRDDSSS